MVRNKCFFEWHRIIILKFHFRFVFFLGVGKRNIPFPIYVKISKVIVSEQLRVYFLPLGFFVF